MQVERILQRRVPTLRILSPVDRPLGQLERKPRLGCDLAGHGQGRVFKVVAAHNLVDHPKTVRVLGGQRIGGKQHLLCLASTDLPKVAEVLNSADTKAHRWISEAGIVGGNDEVAGPHKHQSAGDAFTLDRSDRWLWIVPPTLAEAEIDLFLATHLRFGPRAAKPADRANGVVVRHGTMRITFAQIMT